MKKGTIFGKIFGIALVLVIIAAMPGGLLAALPSSGSWNQSQALVQATKTWYVDDDLVDCPDADFTRIQDGMDASSFGDIIIVCPGNYHQIDFIIEPAREVVIEEGVILRTKNVLLCEGAHLIMRGILYRQTIHLEDGASISMEGGQIIKDASPFLIVHEAQTDNDTYSAYESVQITGMVLDENGARVSANVTAEIEEPDGSIETISLNETGAGSYEGTFTNTSVNGTYRVAIQAETAGYVGHTVWLSFEVGQLKIVVSTSGHFVSGEGDWSRTAAVPINVQVLDYQDNPVEGAAILLEGIPYGQTNVSGRLDFLWPIPDSPPIEGPFRGKVEALWYHLSAESETVLYNAEKLECKQATLTAAEAFIYNSVSHLKHYSDRPSVPAPWRVWDLYNVIVALLEHYLEYHAHAGDVATVATYKYAAADVAPAWLIRETVMREEQIILELNSWTESEIKYLDATSPMPSSPYLNRGGFMTNLASPATLYITAPDGSHAGYDPLTGELVFDFPIAISDPGDEPFQMFVPQPADGEYLLSVIGTGVGNYTLSIQVLDSNGMGGSGSNSTMSINEDEIHTYSIIVPISGCYIGAYLGCGSDDLSCESISDFNQEMGKNHAIFVRYVDVADSENPSHFDWAQEVKENGAMPMFIYDPWDGLDAINITDVGYFASECNELNTTGFIVFGHEMNGPWYPWGNAPDNYTSKFKEVAEIFHENAPNVEMCWVPNQNWGYPWGGTDYGDGYSEYYPEGTGTYGEYVDWVGLNFYEKDWDEDNLVPPDMFVANIRNGQDSADFYEMFAVGKNKPMLIAEMGAFDPNKGPTGAGERDPLNGAEQAEFKNEWLEQAYNVTTLQEEFPRLNAICYFHVSKTETVDTQSHSFYDITADYRIPESPNVYENLISDPYFIGAVTYNLTISSMSGGSVTTPGEATYSYNASEVVPLVAAADSGYYFVNWTGDVGTIANVNSATTNITVNGNYSITANFAKATCGDICVNTTGWWRDGGTFNASATPIQSAVDNATAGETICVKDGTYNENVDVNTANLTIQSENGTANCVVSAASSNDHVFEVTANWVNITGFTVENATTYKAGIYLGSADHCNISSNNATGNYYGIWLSQSDNNTLTNNTASNNSRGIRLLSSSNNTLSNNTANSNFYYYGIYLYYSSYNTLNNNTASNNSRGIYLSYSSNNTLSNNIADDNEWNGIYLHLSDGNNLSNNSALNNEYGMRLHYSNNNDIMNGDVNTNNRAGIYLSYSFGNAVSHSNIAYNHHGVSVIGSISNEISHNNISYNVHGIWLCGSSDSTISCNNITYNSNGILEPGEEPFPSDRAGTFSISGPGTYPRFTKKLVMDPFDVRQGEKQTFSIWAEDPQGIERVYAVVDTDKDDELIEFELVEGMGNLGRWMGSWVTRDISVVSAYTTSFYAVNNGGNNTRLSASWRSLGSVISSSTISQNNIKYNDYGIWLHLSNSNTIEKNNVSDNGYDGIRLEGSSGNSSIRYNIANSNYLGIYLGSSSNNTIYNNYFSNTNNAWDDGNNTWNTTKTNGTNIIGGPYLGGNYWSDYAGSDTDGDGLGNTLLPYNCTGNITNGGDYLPLVPAAGATLEGNVTFPGRGNPPSSKWVENFTVRFYEGGNETLWSPMNRTTDEHGNFTIEGLDLGNYDISIKNWTCLTELVANVTLTAGNTTYVDFGTTREGDCNDDNWVTLEDRSLLYAGWDTQEVIQGGHYCDLNGDGWLTLEDRSLMYANWDQGGD